MKKVTNSKRRFGRKDLLSWMLIMLGHYAAFAAYMIIFLLAKWLSSDVPFWPTGTAENTWVIITLIAAPALNGLFHILYDEIGSPWTRFSMWVYSFINMIFIPIMIFVFL